MKNDDMMVMFVLMLLTDDEFKRFKNKEPLILEKIYEEHKKSVFNFIYIKTGGNINLANDIVCDTFYSMIESAPYIRENKSIQNWLLKIAVRKLYDYFRKEYSEKRKKDLIERNPEDIGSEKSDEISENNEILMINLALENVKEKYKRILKLKYIENKSLEEISKILDSPFTTINGLLVRARRSLKKEFLKISKDF